MSTMSVTIGPSMRQPPMRVARIAEPATAEAEQSNDAWQGLSVACRAYVAVVIGLGGATLLLAVEDVREHSSMTLFTLLGLSVLASCIKITLPVHRSVSTLTVGYVIDFAALLILGTQASVVTAALGAWSQCTLRSRFRNPLHQTAFSMASLALAARAAGEAYTSIGAGGHGAGPVSLESLMAGATVFFVVNSGLVAGAIALATGQALRRVWTDHYGWSWPGYVIGAGVAAAAAAGLERSALWLLPFLTVPLLLTYQNFAGYVKRLTEVTTDPLTGLANVRSLQAHGEHALATARRNASPATLYVIDLDGFKALNDRLGHQQGNLALTEVAACLTRLAGRQGTCARFGGDEFVVLMPGHADSASALFVHALQDAIAGLGFGEGASRTYLGASVGCAEFPRDGATVDELLLAADSRMYRNKAGRRGFRATARIVKSA